MKKGYSINVLYLFLSLVFHFGGQAQYIIDTPTELQDLRGLPQEVVYAAHTGPVVFSGEDLYFSIYCFNVQTRKASTTSRIAYADLISPEGDQVLRAKILLRSGQGQGSFFIPADLKTGSYKLLAYTNWMKNSGVSQVYQDDILIVNPYRGDAFQASGPPVDSVTPVVNKEEAAFLSVDMPRKAYGLREAVPLALRNYKGVLGYGNYTIWVKKKEAIPYSQHQSGAEFVSIYNKAQQAITLEIGDSLYLPEQRGELVYGTIRSREPEIDVTNLEVALNFPGDQFLLDFARCDRKGNFYHYILEPNQEESVIIQPLTDRGQFTAGIYAPGPLDPTGLKFAPYRIPDSLKAHVVQRSVQNQIEHQFFAVKPDSLIEEYPYDPFLGGVVTKIMLDDYTRFKTLAETLEEVVPFAGFRRLGPDRYYVRIAQDFQSFNEPYNNNPALVLVDGVYIHNPGELREMDARQLESISLVREPYDFNYRSFHGILYIATKNGDYDQQYKGERVFKDMVMRPQPVISYFKQHYSMEENTYDRIPDYRRLLFWKPNLELQSGKADFTFFTSDVEGTYELFVEGFTTYGKPISMRYEFEVQNKNASAR